MIFVIDVFQCSSPDLTCSCCFRWCANLVNFCVISTISSFLSLDAIYHAFMILSIDLLA